MNAGIPHELAYSDNKQVIHVHVHSRIHVHMYESRTVTRTQSRTQSRTRKPSLGFGGRTKLRDSYQNTHTHTHTRDIRPPSRLRHIYSPLPPDPSPSHTEADRRASLFYLCGFKRVLSLRNQVTFFLSPVIFFLLQWIRASPLKASLSISGNVSPVK